MIPAYKVHNSGCATSVRGDHVENSKNVDSTRCEIYQCVYNHADMLPLKVIHADWSLRS